MYRAIAHQAQYIDFTGRASIIGRYILEAKVKYLLLRPQKYS